MKRTPITERFWPKVAIRGEDECWPWLASKRYGGYGQIGRDGGGGSIPSHRLAYELTFGEIGQGMVVCHRCDNPECCNPKHLFVGTQADNLADMKNKGRLRTGNRAGANNPRAKLTSQEVVEIRVRHSHGEAPVPLAAHYGVRAKQIIRIIKGEAWKS